MSRISLNKFTVGLARQKLLLNLILLKKINDSLVKTYLRVEWFRQIL
jgi:hypothetical protein